VSTTLKEVRQEAWSERRKSFHFQHSGKARPLARANNGKSGYGLAGRSFVVESLVESQVVSYWRRQANDRLASPLMPSTVEKARVGAAVVLPPLESPDNPGWQYNCHPNLRLA
jgi:hypothetical protein